MRSDQTDFKFGYFSGLEVLKIIKLLQRSRVSDVFWYRHNNDEGSERQVFGNQLLLHPYTKMVPHQHSACF